MRNTGVQPAREEPRGEPTIKIRTALLVQLVYLIVSLFGERVVWPAPPASPAYDSGREVETRLTRMETKLDRALEDLRELREPARRRPQ